MTKRKQPRQPGKKRGNRISNTLVLKPLNVKDSTYEIHARMSLAAIKLGNVTQHHLANLYVLADMSHRIGGEAYIDVHSATIKRLCEKIHDEEYRCDDMTFSGLSASTGVLLNFIHAQKNSDIEFHAKQAVAELMR